jgi:hypothetical protein
LPLKVVFHFNRIVLKSGVFLGFLSGSVANDFDTKENATVRYDNDTIEVENRQKLVLTHQLIK